MSHPNWCTVVEAHSREDCKDDPKRIVEYQQEVRINLVVIVKGPMDEFTMTRQELEDGIEKKVNDFLPDNIHAAMSDMGLSSLHSRLFDPDKPAKNWDGSLIEPGEEVVKPITFDIKEVV